MDISGFTHYIYHMLTQYVKKRKGLREVSISKLYKKYQMYTCYITPHTVHMKMYWEMQQIMEGDLQMFTFCKKW